MSKCPCDPPKKPEPPWTPIPGKAGTGTGPTAGASAGPTSASISDTELTSQNKPTEILPGENIDCYAKRAGNPSGLMDDVAEVPPNKIANTSLTSDLEGKVNTFFKMTPNSPDQAVTWRIWFNGQPGVPSGMGLTFNTSTGQLSGQVNESFLNKNYKVLVKAFKNTTEEIDSREFNFFPKKGKKDDTIKFVFPYSPNGRITSPFGPRNTNIAGASKNHNGVDISQPSSALGDILSAADGVVTYVGPGRGYGNYVQIEHRDATGKLVATTRYAHMKLSEIYVSVGQKVAAGQKIAKEGSEGVGSGPHLHFELHKPSVKNPVDPVPYITGTFEEAKNNLPGQPNVPDPGSIELINNENVGMTRPESQATLDDCPDRLPNQAGDTAGYPPVPNPQASPQPPLGPEPPTVPVNPSTAEVQAAIQKALDEDPSLTDADKKHLMFVAKIESGFDADAKNPASSARGVYQMLDKTADSYYKKIGVEPTIQNRNDPYLATKAQIEFYKNEQKRYWEEFQASGGTKIAGKTLSPEVQARYAGLTQGEFTYGLIHHDGVGNAVKGVDRQGVDYYRKKIRSSG